MFSRANLIKFVKRVWGNQVFLILLIVNLLSNGVAAVVYPDALSVFLIFGISALSATIESLICRLFRNLLIRKCLLWLFVAIHLCMAIVDIFLIVNFQMIFTQDSLGIIAETTPEETKAFFSTYLDLKNVLCIILLVVFLIWLCVWISHKLAKRLSVAMISMLLTIVGALAYAHMGYSHAVEGQGGLSLSQMHSFTRLAYSVLGFKSNYQKIQVYKGVNSEITATLRQEEAPSIILVIGESFSLYHSSLYGYLKQTNPLLMARAEEGSMTVFDDVVATSDHTGIVMDSVFIANGSGESYDKAVFFPAFFRSVGYKTALLDNQYFVGSGLSWPTDGGLSEVLFDYRNSEKAGLDINLIAEIPDFPDPQLVIVHLFGQHFEYSARYPSSFSRFKESDYNQNLTREEREVVAHYDNSTLYNDFVVDSIIKKYEDKNCMVVYFSDHGEEIYEIDDFMGHGNATKRPSILYQVRVPFMIWTSDKFRSHYPDVVKRIKESKHKPLNTKHLPHFLFDVAGIETKYFCPELSFINDRYDGSAPRIILGSINYEEAKKQQTVKPRY